MLRVIVVEDMALIAMEIRDLLEELGHEVVAVAGNIADALHTVRSVEPRPDFVMLDANLHGKSAAPVAAVLQELGIPFIIASGYGDETLAAMGNEAPRLSKPVSKIELDRVLSQLLANKAI